MASLVARALALLEDDLERPWQLDELASRCHCHPTHLVRAFAQRTGYTPMGYLRARRLTLAAQQLLNGGDALAVALALGYQSQQAFSRAFRRQFGMSLTQLRQAGEIPPSRCVTALQLQTIEAPAMPAVERCDWPRLQLAGVQAALLPSQRGAIPGLWQRLYRLQPEAVNKPVFGVVSERSLDGCMSYTAAVACHQPVSSTASDWQQWSLPAGSYMSFTGIESPQQLAPLMSYVWDVWLEQQGRVWLSEQAMALADQPYFSHIDERGQLSVHIPLQGTSE